MVVSPHLLSSAWVWMVPRHQGSQLEPSPSKPVQPRQPSEGFPWHGRDQRPMSLPSRELTKKTPQDEAKSSTQKVPLGGDMLVPKRGIKANLFIAFTLMFTKKILKAHFSSLFFWKDINIFVKSLRKTPVCIFCGGGGFWVWNTEHVE